MDVYKIRKENLLRLLEEQFGGVKKAMGDVTNLSPRLLHAYTTDKAMGPRVVRKIEESVDLPCGWMDQLHAEKVC